MKNRLLISGTIIVAALTGCASKGFVTEEVNRNKTEIVSQMDKNKTETSAQLVKMSQEVNSAKDASAVILQSLLGILRAEKKRFQEAIESLDREIKDLEKVISSGAPKNPPTDKNESK